MEMMILRDELERYPVVEHRGEARNYVVRRDPVFHYIIWNRDSFSFVPRGQAVVAIRQCLPQVLTAKISTF
jgi:hypothetical protein